MIKSLLTFTTLLLLATGCASMAPMASPVISSGGDSSVQMHSQTSVNLAEGNFVVIKTNVAGHSKGFKLLGLIPITSARLTLAMDRLYAEAGIQAGSSKTLAHVIIEHSSTFWLLFSIPETTVRADVVQFHASPTPATGTK